MKKIFTLLALCVIAVAAHASITIYVQATEAPYLYVWNGADNGSWPGTQMTETAVVNGTTFWKQSFDATGFNIIFNNGAGKQTKDITGIVSDRYFTYDGETTYTDVTTEYGGEIPDATITSLLLAGNHTTPVWGDGAQPFTAVEEGKTYTITVDLTNATVEEDLWKFKLVANGGTWFGYSAVTLNAPEWVAQAIADDNFEIDLDPVDGTSERVFTFTATWGGGKQAGENWTLKIEASSSGVNSLKADSQQSAAIYNLAGQRVDSTFRGIAVQNGRKFVVR